MNELYPQSESREITDAEATLFFNQVGSLAVTMSPSYDFIAPATNEYLMAEADSYSGDIYQGEATFLVDDTPVTVEKHEMRMEFGDGQSETAAERRTILYDKVADVDGGHVKVYRLHTFTVALYNSSVIVENPMIRHSPARLMPDYSVHDYKIDLRTGEAHRLRPSIEQLAFERAAATDDERQKINILIEAAHTRKSVVDSMKEATGLTDGTDDFTSDKFDKVMRILQKIRPDNRINSPFQYLIEGPSDPGRS